MASKDIITGQFVRIEQTPASIGDRFFARLIDVVAIIFYTISITFFISTAFNNAPQSDIGYTIFTTLVLILYAPIFAYAFLCEYFFDGRTLGKAIMGTRVIMADGSAPTIGALFLRWLFEMIDIMCSCIGLLFIAITKHHQRIGDLAAGTMVIKNPDLTTMSLSLTEFSYASKDYRPIYPEAQNLSLGQANVISKVLYGQVMYDNQKVNELANKVVRVTGAHPRTPNAIYFLVDILHDYQYYALQIV